MTRYKCLFVVLLIIVSSCVGCYGSYSTVPVRYTEPTGKNPQTSTSLQINTTNKADAVTEDTTIANDREKFLAESDLPAETIEKLRTLYQIIDEAFPRSRQEDVEFFAQEMIISRPEMFGVWEGQPIEFAFELYDYDFISVVAYHYHVVDEVSGEIVGNITINRDDNSPASFSLYTSVYDDPDSRHHRRSGDRVSIYHNQ